MFLQAFQKWTLGDRDFQATPNTRNEMMLKEASEFAGHLKRCEKDIRALKNATEGKAVRLFISELANCSPQCPHASLFPLSRPLIMQGCC